MSVFKAVEVFKDIWWVGAVDWAIRDFHGYATHRGTTYNAFLITGGKLTLIDTVKAPFKEEMLSRIASVADPKDIDIIVSNHAEMDHSALLPDMVELCRPAAVYASKMGARALAEHFHGDFATVVKSGDRVDLGGHTLSFFETRMLHWPDSMVTYLAGEQVLFSQDAFGMHLAGYERFADQVPEHLLKQESLKYFANILNPYAPQVKGLLDKLPSLGVAPKLILPDHGPAWRDGDDRIVQWYRDFATPTPSRKVVIAFDTMWGSTDKMARAAAEGVSAAGGEPRVMPLKACHRSDVATELMGAGGFMVGSPTLNNHLYPTVADCLTYVKGLRFTGLTAAAFGSYGWGGEAVKQVGDALTDMGCTVVEPVSVRFAPDQDVLSQCAALGRAVVERIPG